MSSPTQRSLAFLRKQGHVAAVVEKSIPWPRPRGTKIDLFGFADVISFDEDAVTLTQTTSTPNIQSRINKTMLNPLPFQWLAGRGRRIEVHGWAKRSWKLKNGKRAPSKRWKLTRNALIRFQDELSVIELDVDGTAPLPAPIAANIRMWVSEGSPPKMKEIAV